VIRATRVSFAPAIRSIRDTSYRRLARSASRHARDPRDPRLVILLIRAICVSSHE